MNEERRKGAELVAENTRLNSVVVKEQESSQTEKDKLAQLQAELSSLKVFTTAIEYIHLWCASENSSNDIVDYLQNQLSKDVSSTVINNSTTNGISNGKSANVSAEAEVSS